MQRVLHEILRRASDNTDRSNKKRKLDVANCSDGKFAEEMYDRETRGHRPGMSDWNIKRKKPNDWEISGPMARYTAVYQ